MGLGLFCRGAGRPCARPRRGVGTFYRALDIDDLKIGRADGAASYVFGTLHSTDERVTALPQPVSDAFVASRTLAVECILDNPAIFKISRAMLLPGGKRLGPAAARTLRQTLVPDADELAHIAP